MYSRKLFRAINQAKEVLRASPGYRRDQTWAAIPDTLRLLPTDQFSTLNVILSRPASNGDAQQMIDSLTQFSTKLWIMTSGNASLNGSRGCDPVMLNNFTGSKTDQNVSLLPLQSFLANLLPIRMHAWMPFHRYGKISTAFTKRANRQLMPFSKNMVSTFSEAFPIYHLSMPIKLSLSSRKSDLHRLVWTMSRHSILSISQNGRLTYSITLLICSVILKILARGLRCFQWVRYHFCQKTDEPSPSAQDFQPLTILSAI